MEKTLLEQMKEIKSDLESIVLTSFMNLDLRTKMSITINKLDSIIKTMTRIEELVIKIENISKE